MDKDAQCGEVFGYKSNRNRHMRTRTGKRTQGI